MDIIYKQNHLFINTSSIDYRKEKTINGYDFDVTKSAMQKYARRGHSKECLYVMFEMYCFKFIDGGKGYFTNFKNRIRTILLEDVGIASPMAIPLGEKYLKKIEKSNTPFCPELVKLSYLMCNTLHSRLYSHINAFFKVNKPCFTRQLVEHTFLIGDDKEEYGNDVNMLIASIHDKSIDCFWWMNIILSKDVKLKTKRYDRTMSGYLIFSVIEWYFNHIGVDKMIMENFHICLNWYKEMTIKEKVICIFHPLFMYINNELIVKTNYVSKFKLENDITTYFKNNIHNIKLEFVSAIYDLHTKKGRYYNRSHVDFVIEGSLIAFSDTILNNQEAHSIYNDLKLMNSQLRRESELFTLKTRVQLTCSKCRPDVYYAKDFLGNNVVVKGPFLLFEDADKCFQLSRILSLFENVNTIETNIVYCIPDMFNNVPIGIRNKILDNTGYYFLVYKDMFNMNHYPTKIVNSKLWEDETVVDFEALFSLIQAGTGYSKSMTNDAKVSLIYQLAIRYVFELGDFATRNFIWINDNAYNVDIDNFFVSTTLRWSMEVRQQLANIYVQNTFEVQSTFNRWLEDFNVSNPSLYTRWIIIQRTIPSINIDNIYKNIMFIQAHFYEWIIG